VLFAAWVPSVWLWTYDLSTRAVLTTGPLLVLVLAALGGGEGHPRRRPGFTRPDAAVALFALTMAVAAARGWMADHSRSAVLGDVYHQLVVVALVYAAFRVAVRSADVPRFLIGWVTATAIVAVLQISVLALYPIKPDWVWMVGAPLDEGGARLKPDFGFPTLAAVVAGAIMWQRARLRDIVSGTALLAAMILTYKRTFWIAGGTGLIAAWMIDTGVGGRRGRGRPVAHLLATGALGVALAFLVGVNAESVRTRATGLADPLNVNTVETRFDEFGPTLAHIATRPFGIGFGGTIEIPTESGARRAHYVHNAYLQWTLLGGAPAGIAMIACIGLVLVRVVRHRRDRWLLPLGASVLAAAISGLAVQSFYSPLAAMSLAVAVTRSGMIRSGDDEAISG
jgi:hypothetical protein